jgi:hypothetical protein
VLLLFELPPVPARADAPAAPVALRRICWAESFQNAAEGDHGHYDGATHLGST